VGAKSLGAYGGYETFVDKLTEYHEKNEKIKYYVACKKNGDGCMNLDETKGVQIINHQEFIYHNAHCFQIKIPQKIGSAQAIYYDIAALKECCRIIQNEQIQHPIVYIMACRIGPFIRRFYEEIHRLGGKVYLNPDGHEWKRKKWSIPIRKYWKRSEKMMVKYCDLVICDSVNIENYIHEQYDGQGIKGKNPPTKFIAYGAETRKSVLADDDANLGAWYKERGLTKKNYYLVVGRFVPENNYEIMIREFMKSKSKRDFAIITNVNDKFLGELEEKLHFKQDPRIKFVGTVYEQELLKKIRENAYGYFHGHEVGGTNPSLLEALGST
jgi:rhamnosyltransferase